MYGPWKLSEYNNVYYRNTARSALNLYYFSIQL